MSILKTSIMKIIKDLLVGETIAFPVDLNGCGIVMDVSASVRHEFQLLTVHFDSYKWSEHDYYVDNPLTLLYTFKDVLMIEQQHAAPIAITPLQAIRNVLIAENIEVAPGVTDKVMCIKPNVGKGVFTFNFENFGTIDFDANETIIIKK